MLKRSQYSCIGVNKKLDRLARDITFTHSINLVTTLSNEHHNSILDRFCSLILQRIQHNIQCLTLDSLSVDRVLRIGNYSKLHKLSLVNLPIEMETVSNLKYFSLISFRETIEYDAKIVPLLRHMSKLEKLTLSLIVDRRNSFIDGHHLVNDILSKMSHLRIFIFNIITKRVIIDEEFLVTRDNILRPLIEKRCNAGCYTDYCTISDGQCHIFSLPFTLERMDVFTNKFPDSCLFMNVRHFAAGLIWRPFEHEFFAQISRAFPLLNKLEIHNILAQNKKITYQQDGYEQTSIIEFPHLTVLDLSGSSLDYVKQFLFDFYTRLPSLNTLHVEYQLLLFATQYFTEDAARANCLKVKHIFFNRKPKTYPENFRDYFPLL
ncbi:unnamed protein product [Adineta steineri]|uniref:Uncharacterized protein n=1 Tax=Adineta steineri TaxID=433720 RepID=A0A813S9L3_9BILA|nr:unnamed protein product [Adineta steineri]CAF3703199.1 unnamed protein product [Adineta steineri]